MKRIDRYIITSYLGPMLLTFAIVLFVLVLQFIWLYIDEIVGKGLEFSVIAEFIFWGGVTFIPLALPLSTMLASLMTMGSMGENNELLAMKAAGMSVKRIIRPLVSIAAIVSIIAFFVSNNLLPIANLNISSLMSDIRHKRSEVKIPTGIFYNGIIDYSIRIERQNPHMMYNIILYDHTAHRGNNSVTRADSGYIRFSNDKQYLIFKLFDGHTYEDQQQNAGDSIYPFQKRYFTEQEVLIPLRGYEFKRGENDERFKGFAKMKSLGTLGYESDSLRKQEQTLTKEFLRNFHYRTNLVRSYEFDTLLLINAQYVHSFAGDSIFNASTDEEKLNIISSAADRISMAVSQIDMHVAGFEQYDYSLRRVNIEWHRKFALSIACLIFFFIGAPLGTIIRKGGLGVPAVISIFFFVLYWVVDISGVKLARDGMWQAVVGMWLSSAVLLPISIFITYKATTDSNLFNIDRYVNFFNSITKVFKRKRKQPLRIVFMGTPEFAAHSLQNLIEKKYQVVGVVTAPDKPAGRGLSTQASAVKETALKYQLPILQPDKLRDEQFLEELKSCNADLFVVVAFRMLPEVVWRMPRYGAFNLHASLLPQYRGAAPINWAIINGETSTGLTTFFLDEKIDTGQIIFNETTTIGPEENAGQLHDRLMCAGAALVCKTIDAIAAGNLQTSPQLQSSPLKPAPKIHKDTCRINWNDTAQAIHNLIRGLSPYPAAFSELKTSNGDIITTKIYVANYSFTTHELPNGTIASDNKTFLKVACSTGFIEIQELQLAGKKRVAVKDFLLGFREIAHCSFID